ncbi:Tyrosine-protein kinase YwqD [Planococcus massiliensis]|uniref:non-specific protein-tyrosine kinase n=1 Tax=Planococcus massiliensis TaxID=1499687 RepID=A0A098EJV4_9BACL|nr:CpsD/CapB family tyrosine-protein kinase [Planococcus massiliensis]CEG22100.1 Tyrosine-protein kinase YwqD [Planococcus massiliensis]
MSKSKKKIDRTGRKLVAYTMPKSFVSEQFRNVRTNIHFSTPDKEIRSLAITSAAPGEGKSTAAANLAVVFAQEGKKVLLIDGDMRKPTMHHTFEIRNTVGLSSVLTRRLPVEAAIKKGPISGLHLLTCGPIPPNPAELLASETMAQLIQHLGKSYDLVIFDSPPILSVADGKLIADHCEGTVLIINSGTTEKRGALKAKEMIEMTSSKLLGIVLNNFTSTKETYYYQY